MAVCANCGAELPSNARFCPNCGAPVDRDEPLEETAPASPAPARRLAERIAFGLLLALTAALVMLAVLVFAFGMFVEG